MTNRLIQWWDALPEPQRDDLIAMQEEHDPSRAIVESRAIFDWADPGPALSPCGPTIPRCYRCGKIGANCPVIQTRDVSGRMAIHYCGID